eukprot:7001295-Prymnesium_polylepis.1
MLASTGRQRRVAAPGPYGAIRSISSKSTRQLRHSSPVHSPVGGGGTPSGGVGLARPPAGGGKRRLV